MEPVWTKNVSAHIPVVPLKAFLSLAGPELAKEADRQLRRADLVALVLFTDESGMRLALMATGPGCEHAEPGAVAGREIDGLRPLCALFREDVALSAKE